jgi:DNA modification methylase
MKVSIDSVKVDRKRFRDATGDMEGLAQSILTFGQLQPIVLQKDGELVAGFRRLSAHKLNGMSEIDAVYLDDIDEIAAREIELEENIQREQMTWQEQQLAIAEIHRLKQARDPNWGRVQTQQVIGAKRAADVSDAIKLTNAFELFPELKNAKSKGQAMNWLDTKVKQVARVIEVKNNHADFADIESKILLGDSVELIKTVPDEHFDAIITDPPFGVDYDARTAGTEGSLNAYQDDAASYRRILTMAADTYRVAKPNSFLVWFFGISWYQEVVDAFSKAGWVVDPVPLIWDRRQGRTFTNRPDHLFNKAYDVAIHAYKGDPKMVKQGLPNIVSVAPVAAGEREFMVERPLDLYRHYIEALTIPGQRVLDCFVGSGSCPAACASLKRDYIGFELNPERRAGAIQKIRANTPA